MNEIWNIKGFKQIFKSIYGQESFNAVSCQTVDSSISVCKWIELELKGLKTTLRKSIISNLQELHNTFQLQFYWCTNTDIVVSYATWRLIFAKLHIPLRQQITLYLLHIFSIYCFFSVSDKSGKHEISKYIYIFVLLYF